MTLTTKGWSPLRGVVESRIGTRNAWRKETVHVKPNASSRPSSGKPSRKRRTATVARKRLGGSDGGANS